MQVIHSSTNKQTLKCRKLLILKNELYLCARLETSKLSQKLSAYTRVYTVVHMMKLAGSFTIFVAEIIKHWDK